MKCPVLPGASSSAKLISPGRRVEPCGDATRAPAQDAALTLNIPWKQSTLTVCLSVKSRIWCARAELNGASIRRTTDSCVRVLSVIRSDPFGRIVAYGGEVHVRARNGIRGLASGLVPASRNRSCDPYIHFKSSAILRTSDVVVGFERVPPPEHDRQACSTHPSSAAVRIFKRLDKLRWGGSGA